MTPTRWLARPVPRPDADVRLYAFPYAGGGTAIYRTWARALPGSIELNAVQLPGRESRISETPLTDIATGAAAVADAIAAQADRPYALFGYSMGALHAFETARRLARLGVPPPLVLIVAAHVAPDRPTHRRRMFDLPDDELIAELQSIGGTPRELFENRELLDLFLPVLRADFQACDTYRSAEGEPLDVPLVVFGAPDDDQMAWDDVQAWDRHTTAGCAFRKFTGGHFFIHKNASVIVDRVALIINEQKRSTTWPQTQGKRF